MSIWDAIIHSFIFNIIFSFLTIILLLYFLFRIAPHTGSVSFSGDKENTYIDTTADNVWIECKNLSENNIAGIEGDVYVIYCQVNDKRDVNDYEIIRLNGMFEYTALGLDQLASYGIESEDSNVQWFDNELAILSVTTSSTDETLYDLKNSFRASFDNSVYSYNEVDSYLNSLLLQALESSTIYSIIMQEVRGYKTNQREVGFKYYSSKDTCSVNSSNIFCYSSGYKVRPLADNCKIEILDPEASISVNIENTTIMKSIPIQDEFIISRSNKYYFEYGGCICIENGSCDISNSNCDPIIKIEGSEGVQAEITGDLDFYYSNEPTKLTLHDRILVHRFLIGYTF